MPWHIWPLLCDLHKKYREEKVKIYTPVVFTYVNTLPVLRVYERVFDPEGMKERVFNSKKEAEAAVVAAAAVAVAAEAAATAE